MDVLAAPPHPSDTLEKCITSADKTREGREREVARHFVHQSGKRWVEGEGHIAHKIAHNNAVH